MIILIKCWDCRSYLWVCVASVCCVCCSAYMCLNWSVNWSVFMCFSVFECVSLNIPTGLCVWARPGVLIFMFVYGCVCSGSWSVVTVVRSGSMATVLASRRPAADWWNATGRTTSAPTAMPANARPLAPQQPRRPLAQRTVAVSPRLRRGVPSIARPPSAARQLKRRPAKTWESKAGSRKPPTRVGRRKSRFFSRYVYMYI